MKQINTNNIPTAKAHNEVNRKAMVKIGDLFSCIQAVNYAYLEPNKGFKPYKQVDCEEIYYFSEGEGIMKIGNKTFTAKLGNSVIVQQNEYHSLKNSGSKKLRCITIRAIINSIDSI